MNIYLFDTKTVDPDTGNSVVKIGITGNVRTRERELTRYNPLGEMIASGDGDREYELDLHNRYSNLNIKNEFFALSTEKIDILMEEIGTHEVDAIRNKKEERKKRARIIIKQLNHYKAMGWR